MKRISRQCPASGPGRQGGYTLLLAMLMIVVMTVFGIFALNGSIMQGRMAANYQDAQVAFEAAEMGLRWGESWLQSRTPQERPFPCQSTVLSDCRDQPNSVVDVYMIPYDVETESPVDTASTWKQLDLPYGIDPEDLTDTGAAAVPGVAAQPMMLLEQSFVDRDDLAGDPQQGRVFYRVLAHSTGERAATLSVLESAVAKRFQ